MESDIEENGQHVNGGESICVLQSTGTFFVAALAALIWSLRAAYSSSDRCRVSRYLILREGSCCKHL